MILRIATAVVSLWATVTTATTPDQVVLGPSSMNDFVRSKGNRLPTLADLLTVETRASIFYSYSREVELGALFLEDVDEGDGVTVFVPTNKAVQALSSKPNEDPSIENVEMSNDDYESISRRSVHRWVGAHIIPIPDVDITSPEPYDTLTHGISISFKPIDTLSSVDMDAAHFADIKGSAGKSGQTREQSPGGVDTDAAHFSAIKGSGKARCSAKKGRTPLAAKGHVDTDAAHSSRISSNHAPQSAVQTPIWKRYELSDGVSIISKHQASNGVMYLIDGTVQV